jgi:hypothetical protein
VPYAQHHRKQKGAVRLTAERDLSDGLVSAQLFSRLPQLFSWQPLKDGFAPRLTIKRRSFRSRMEF